MPWNHPANDRRYLIERLVREITKFDDEFRREKAESAVESQQGTEGLRRIAAGSHALPALRSRLHCRSCLARETSHRLGCRCAALEV